MGQCWTVAALNVMPLLVELHFPPGAAGVVAAVFLPHKTEQRLTAAARPPSQVRLQVAEWDVKTGWLLVSASVTL